MNEPTDGLHRHSLPQRGRGWFAWACLIAAALVVLIVLYVLSLGPAVWLHASLSGKPHWPRDAIEIIYAPLKWWFDQDLPGRVLLGAYVEWWSDLAD
jgi:hypothetical protein